jgi:penicillin-binding protein A
MNAPLRRVAVATLLLFGMLLVNVNYIQVIRADEYQNDTRNQRVLLRTYERERGPILAGEGSQVLAESIETDGRFRYLRTYPGGDAGPTTWAHVTGFFSFVYGPTGLERSADSVLSGEDDALFVRRISDLVTGRDAQGGAVSLTLQPDAQEAAVEGLGSQRGSVVALDPRTGAVLAMASTPSFDPSPISSFDGQEVRSSYEALRDDERQPLINRATSFTYPPGSIFKVVTAASALEGGDYTSESQIPAPDRLSLPQTTATIGNFGESSCGGGTITLAASMTISCNTSFAQLGLDLGAARLNETAEAFGIGDSINVPLPVAASGFPGDANPPQTAQSAIGQFDVRVTPMQAALIAAGIANDGSIMAPYMVDQILAPDLSVVSSASPSEYRRAVTAETADALTAMMTSVVSSGTGTGAQISGVDVAGKTGTAQRGQGQNPHAWFIGFAPADDPRVAVAVVVEDGGSVGSGATGGRLSAPIARSVMQAVLAGTDAEGEDE